MYSAESHHVFGSTNWDVILDEPDQFIALIF